MGVDVENITKHIYTGKNDEYHFITVANETLYHGYDRLIKSLDRYYMENNFPYIFIHFVNKNMEYLLRSTPSFLILYPFSLQLYIVQLVQRLY